MNSNFSSPVDFRSYRLTFKSPVRFFDKFISEKSGIIAFQHNSAVADFPNTDFSGIKKYIKEIEHTAETEFLSRTETETALAEISCSDFPAEIKFGLESMIVFRHVNSLQSSQSKPIDSYPFFADFKELAHCSGNISPKIKFSPSSGCIDAVNQFFVETGIPVRLDFNRRFNIDEAETYISAFYPDAVLYIEEPCSNPEYFPKIQAKFGINYALDESIFSASESIRENCSYFVYKPSIYGDFSFIRKLISGGKSVIISSAFESPAGLESLANLIHFFSLEKISHGLDTAKYFSNFELL